MTNYKVIAFDADDTLWVNEPYFREAETKFAKLLSVYETENKIQQELYKIITGNISLYGYGVKSCILSMVQCAIELSNNQVSAKTIDEIINIGKEMLTKPIEILPGVEDVLAELSTKYKLIVLTKGDLLDQEKKLKKSGLLNFFHHVEVMSEKDAAGYRRILNHLEIQPKEFLMIGNSLKSDILPVLEIGAQAIHIPFHSIWEFEKVDQKKLENQQYTTLKTVKSLTDFL